MTPSHSIVSLTLLGLGSLALSGCLAPHGHDHDPDHAAVHGHAHGHGQDHGHGHGHPHSHGGGPEHTHGLELPPAEHERLPTPAGPASPETAALRHEVEEAMEAHDFARSLELLGRLRQADPRDLWVRLLLSDALVEAGRLDEAEVELQVVLDTKPCTAAYLRAGYLLHLRGDTAAGVEVLRLAVEAAGPLRVRAWAQAELGDLLWQDGQLEAAGACYDQAARLDPALRRAQVGQARVLAAQGALGEAAALMSRAAYTPAHLSELAFWEQARGQAEAARVAVRRARALAEEDPWHWGRQTAVALTDHGQGGRWGVDLARAELARRGSVEGWDALAWALYGAGQLDEAWQASQRALSEGTQEPLLLYHAAVIADALGRADEARQAYARALELNPSFHLCFAGRARARLAALGS